MVKFKVIIPLILALFIWQGIAQAASISTRVRILESKVSKQDKKIRRSEASTRANTIKIDKSLGQVQALKRRVDKLVKASSQRKKVKGRVDKRYAYP